MGINYVLKQLHEAMRKQRKINGQGLKALAELANADAELAGKVEGQFVRMYDHQFQLTTVLNKNISNIYQQLHDKYAIDLDYEENEAHIVH